MSTWNYENVANRSFDLGRLELEDLLFSRLVSLQRMKYLGRVFRFALRMRGIDIPPVTLSPGICVRLPHGGNVVVHHKARIGRHVTIFQGVTVGRSDVWMPEPLDFAAIFIGDGSILCANSCVLSRGPILTLAEGTVLGANSVLLEDTGPYEIWAGIPARKVGTRPRA